MSGDGIGIASHTSWCPGCGNFGILRAEKAALDGLGLKARDVLLVSGIGQAAKTPHYVAANGLCGLHGRALANATGAKLANHALTVLVHTGDGDCLAEGGNHFLHAVRRNVDLTCIIHMNQVYGLTQGQAAPTSDPGFVTRTQPHGVISARANALTLALAASGTFVARGFTGNEEHLSGLIRKAIEHRGFSVIEVLQPCVSMNHVNTFAWYKERVYDVTAAPGTDPADRSAAFAKALEWGDRIPIGVLYREERPCFEDLVPVLRGGPLVRQPALQPEVLEALVDELC
ncbi:MAG: 2-oxoacid:ferredoxin oxidoreductase subunit beta [Deltaproteobacteria bacterium]|nr:2-oxoacid:ferredoxin oxidoreductase subunit beta [Deltaproteobacteria bacterium]